MTAIEVQDGPTPAPVVVSVALMNDYEVVVRGLAHMLSPYAARIRVAEIDVNLAPEQPVDVTLYDTFAVPQANSKAIEAVVNNPLCGRVVVYSWNTHSDLISAGLSKKVAGYLPKTLTADELVAALERVHAGEQVIIGADCDREGADPDLEPEGTDGVAAQHWPGREAGLSPREAEVLALITQGLTNQEIAAHSYLSINTVKTYIRSAYRKIGVTTRARAVLWGVDHDMGPNRVRVMARRAAE
ncbi:MAG: response regulator transcription factor [Ornithinimicrobium sp.]